MAFLYHRFRIGIFITLFASAVASALAYVELAIQGREHWVLGWYLALCVILSMRWLLLQQFLSIRNKSYFPYLVWHNRFFVGVVITGLMLGCGAALLMPYISISVQIILHSSLLTMSAGSIAYLSTSLRIYIAYMLTIMLPVTIWLFLMQSSVTYVLGFLYLFFMTAGYISVKHMNKLVNDALYYKYDNEILIDDLQRLLAAVSQSNKALEKISTTDDVTGISNYRAFRVHLEEIWQRYQGNNLQVSIIKFNVDCYHEFNTHYGQQTADLNLRLIAGILSEQINHQSQLVARLHGAEFALLLPGVSREDARQIAIAASQELARKQVEHSKSDIDSYLTMSVGIGSQFVSPGSSSRELLFRVDTALKLAQQRGHNRIEALEG